LEGVTEGPRNVQATFAAVDCGIKILYLKRFGSYRLQLAKVGVKFKPTTSSSLTKPVSTLSLLDAVMQNRNLILQTYFCLILTQSPLTISPSTLPRKV